MSRNGNLSEVIERIDRWIETIDRFCIILGLTAITGSATLLFLGVLLRYFFQQTYAVFEDLSVNFVIWSVMFFGGPVFKRGGHVGMEFFSEKLRGFKKAALHLILCAILLLICVILLWKGTEIVELVYLADKTTHSGDLKDWYLKMSIPAGGGLFGLFALAQMIKTLFVFKDPSLLDRVFPAAGAELPKPEDPA